MDQHQHDEISLDITTFIEKHTPINDRLTTLLESLRHHRDEA